MAEDCDDGNDCLIESNMWVSGLSRQAQRARFLTTYALQNPSVCLIREFIHDSLYNESYGYFSRQNVPVGSLQQPIDFGSLHAQSDYFSAVQRVYHELQVSWLTPVEIFQPHYGAAIAKYITQHHQQQAQHAQHASHALQIYEIGGGTGTLAQNILDWLRRYNPQQYASCRYTCIEISPSLAQLQQQRVAESGGHAACFDVIQADGARWAAWGDVSHESCYVIMMEVLDNLPHDRVWRPHGGAPWQQTMVSRSPHGLGDGEGESEDLIPSRQSGHATDGPPQAVSKGAAGAGAGSLEEMLVPVSDSLILRCLDCLEDVEEGKKAASGGGWGRLRDWVSTQLAGVGGEAAFLPTGCLQLLDTLHAMRPRHHLLAADFDQLPEVVIPGRNAPLVASTVGGRTIDHDSYLVPRGMADIFFPTDFELLRRLSADAAAHAGRPPARSSPAYGRHMGSADFMRMYADVAATRTRSGYNPLLEDYSNTAFFLSEGP